MQICSFACHVLKSFEAVILMNAIFILYATDYEMRTIDEPLSADVDISVI